MVSIICCNTYRFNTSLVFPGGLTIFHCGGDIGPLIRLACVQPRSAVLTAVSVVSKTR